MITSTSNPKVKRLVNLRKKRKARDEEQVFLAEGLRMCREAPARLLREVYISEDFLRRERKAVDELLRGKEVRAEVLSEHVFAYAADTKTPQGILCVVSRRKPSEADKIRELCGGEAGKSPLILVLDNLQDPGNVGTIVRTAEAAGATGILMSGDCVDIYNPKTVRSTMGSIYRMPFRYADDLPYAVQRLKDMGVRIYAAHLEGRGDYDAENYTGGTAFLIGNEGNGLREEVAALADCRVRIPMEGQVESLNAAVAAAALMFEAGRQRRAAKRRCMSGASIVK